MVQKNLLTDENLIVQFMNGNEFAFEALMKRHKNKVFTTILYIVNDRYLAEDIFQDTFIKAIRFMKSNKYKHEDKFGPWIVRIARNKSIDYLRSAKLKPTITDSEGYSIFDFLGFEDAKAEKNMLENEKSEYVRNMVNKLPEKQKEVLLLRHYADLSFKEIADLTGTNINTCIGRMHYALSNLKKMMEKTLVHVK